MNQPGMNQTQGKLKITYNAPVVLSFTFLCLAVLVLNYLTSGKTNTLLFCTYRARLTNPLMYIRLFTHVLGHANWTHFFNNMLLFILIGPLLEEKYGSKNLLVMIVITAGVTGIINNLFFANVALLGASGVVFMLIVLSSLTAFREHEIPLTFILVVIMYVGQEVLTGIFANDSISQMAHLLGGACGSFFGFFINRPEK